MRIEFIISSKESYIELLPSVSVYYGTDWTGKGIYVEWLWFSLDFNWTVKKS